MQKQMPYTFSIKSDYGRGKETRISTVIVSIESSRSGKQVLRARGHWDGDLHTVINNLPDTPENLSSMGACYLYWDWMRYGAVLAICEIFLEDEIDYDDICHFIDTLEKPSVSSTNIGRKDPEYFKQLEEFAKSIGLKMVDNGW